MKIARKPVSGFDVLSVLIWVQNDCKRYQQMTKIDASKERVNGLSQHAYRGVED